MASSADMLTSVENAITTFLSGGAIVEYQLADGTKVRRESLASLYALRSQLQDEVANVSRGGLCKRIGLNGGGR